ncbi:MAG: hypothetical protein ACRYG6_08120 [Janthinobacterium lividum]
MPTILIRRLVLAAACCAAVAGGATPSLARTRHHAAAARHHAATHAVPASHAAIPQNGNIENLNDLSLRRARAGESTSRPLAPPLAQ